MEKSITKSLNYLLTAPNKGHNDIAVELKVAFHCMTDENHIKEIESEFEKFRVTVGAILERVSAKAND